MNPGSSPPNAGTAHRKSIVVAGIDVGAAKKGFHAVALEGGHFRERHLFHDPAELANWCANGIRATVIAVDAPCRWAGKAGGRPAEHALIGRGIFCFSTPIGNAEWSYSSALKPAVKMLSSGQRNANARENQQSQPS